MATGLSANYPYCASLAVFCAGAVVHSGLQLKISRGCWTQSQLSDVSNGGGHMGEEVVNAHLSPFSRLSPSSIHSIDFFSPSQNS